MTKKKHKDAWFMPELCAIEDCNKTGEPQFCSEHVNTVAARLLGPKLLPGEKIPKAALLVLPPKELTEEEIEYGQRVSKRYLEPKRYPGRRRFMDNDD